MTSWNSRFVVTAEPGPRDIVVVTLADGKRIGACSVKEYSSVLASANTLAEQTKLAVKVLPMTAAEFINFAGIKAVDPAATPEDDADLRRQVVTMLREAMVEADDRATRAEAQALLLGMGEASC